MHQSWWRNYITARYRLILRSSALISPCLPNIRVAIIPYCFSCSKSLLTRHQERNIRAVCCCIRMLFWHQAEYQDRLTSHQNAFPTPGETWGPSDITTARFPKIRGNIRIVWCYMSMLSWHQGEHQTFLMLHQHVPSAQPETSGYPGVTSRILMLTSVWPAAFFDREVLADKYCNWIF